MFRRVCTFARTFNISANKYAVNKWTIEGAVTSLREFGADRGRKTKGTRSWSGGNMAQIHEAARPLTWLLGQWESIEAHGLYPTVDPFTYTEKLTVTHLGQPILNFSSEAWQSDIPKHIECGYIRMNPGTTKVAYICAQNIGMVEIEEGELDGTTIEFTTSSVMRASFAKDPGATGLKRTFRLNPDGILEQIVYMATEKTPMTKHLHIKYKKKDAQ